MVSYTQPQHFVSNIGFLRAFVLDSSLNLSTVIPHIINATTFEAVNQVGRFTFTAPAGDIDDALYAPGKLIRLFYGQQALATGPVDFATKSHNGDVPVVTVTCHSMAIELVWQDTYFGIAADNESASTIIDKILGQAESTWTKVVTGGSYVNMTNQWAPGTSWQTLLTLAEMQNAYIRETNTARQLEMSQTTVVSGVFLSHAPTPAINALLPTVVTGARNQTGPFVPPVTGIVKSLRSAGIDGQGVQNRLVPQGVDSGDAILDLGLSNRSSPYTIQSLLGDVPRVTNSSVFVDSYNESATTEFSLEVTASGPNRGILAWEVLDIPASVVLPFAPTIDGVEGDPIESLNTGGTGHYLATLYWWPHVKAGKNAIRLRYSSGGTADIKVMAVAVSGSYQHANPIRDSNSTFATTGTNATTSVTSAVGDLVLGFLLWTSGTATDDGGQTSILDQGGNAPAAQSAKKTADAASESMTWTLSVSQEWAIAALALKPALIYYIEDSTAITAHRRRTARFIMNANRFVGATATELQNAANTLYDRAVTQLLRSKDPVKAYDVEIASLPDDSPTWLVGDSLRLYYRGRDALGTFVAIDETLIVLERNRNIDENGIITWQLRLSNSYKQPRTIAELLYGDHNRLGELETVQ